MGEIADDMHSTSSPMGQQSDSEGSTSSFDLGPSVAGMAIDSDVSGNVRCRWTACGLCFDHLDLLAAHVTRVHAQAGLAGLFYCGWEGCSRGDRGFNARYKMLVHVRTHTNEKPHRCSKCDKSFSRAENLKIHARSHTGERPYVCPIEGCGKAYSNSSDRFKHTRTHSVDKPYACKVPGCPKRYTDPSSLRKHVKTYRHYPEAEEATRNEDDSRVSPHREISSVKVLKRDSNGAVKIGCTSFSHEKRCDKDTDKSESSLYINAHGSQYDLFRSWLNADLAVLSRSLPLGLWNPLIQGGQDYTKALFEGQRMKHSRLDSTSSEDTVDGNDQDSPLDLTIHRAITRT